LATRSTTAYGSPSTRAASRSAWRPLMVEKVTIWATWSGPVALRHVPDHLPPVTLVEVHVDVGELAAARFQEALEINP